jgi:hypothetical protein
VDVCEVRLSSASGCGSVETTRSSPVRGNRATGGAAFSCDLRALSRYRVLRGTSRGVLRSVDRECAGRNATSVKAVEPRQSAMFRGGRAGMDDRLDSGHAKAALTLLAEEVGTTGVRDHGMHTRQVAVRLRSAASLVATPRPKPAADEGGFTPNFPAMTSAEVRCPHSSVEAAQRPWSEGGHGE